MSRGDFGDLGDIREIKLPDNAGRTLRTMIVVMLVIAAVLSSFYTVSPEEIGVVTRFGAFDRVTDPGLNFRLPFGIERVDKVPVQRQEKQEFGFRTARVSGTRTSYSSDSFDNEGLMLTGDLNAASMEWVVQYRITEPYNYLFRVRNVQDTFRDMTEAVMRRVVGDRTVNEVLTVGRQELASTVEQELQTLCDQYENGIRIEQVVLQNVNPPEPVKPSFNEVNEAQQERERLINQALGEYNRVIPKARGDALKTIQEAEGYFLERVNEARGDSARFVALFEAYEQSPEVTRKRIFLETMTTVLGRVDKKVLVDDSVQGILPLLNLDSVSGNREGGAQ